MAPCPARLLWDGGGLWSLMCLEAAWQSGLCLWPISAASVADGGLEGAGLLVVPGGFSQYKKMALGEAGAREVRRFVERGGAYLGFCGGAGLALSVADGLGLVPLDRATGYQRLPGLSGPVMVRPEGGAQGHAMWQGTTNPARWLVWWPGQFAEPTAPEVKVLARYHGPTETLCVADVPLDQTAAEDLPALEEKYGLSLDPAPLWGQPAVIEARLGEGRLFLSYLHLDTPGDEAGGAALERLWEAWLGPKARAQAPAPPEAPSPRLAQMAASCAELWEQGRGLGLWRHRHPAMPLWSRGARGLEFWELKRLSQATAAWCADEALADELASALESVLRHGERVLQAQATRLAGRETEQAAVEIEAAWFPQPRRVGGDWAEAMEKLAEVLPRALASRIP
ncbi:MAG: hypothetical protein KQH53_08190 [Desulfarculaceae bacterium]|nr:hypothetical protein [Desulfarculaceae bacterium]